jgi:hexosaminidase
MTASRIIPRPLESVPLASDFTLTPATPILLSRADPGLKQAGEYLASLIKKGTGYALAIESRTEDPRQDRAILLTLADTDPELGPEGYRLRVDSTGIRMSAAQPAGLFYAIQTLRQLFPPEFESSGPIRYSAWTLPGIRVTDKPRYAWRGFMLDVSRHFHPKEFIYKVLNYMAFHKLNTFHWHLCDDQGWRIEIRKYPGLTEKAAWRVDREHLHWNARPAQKPGEQATYGGFYTREEIRDIVRYAGERFITIVPEIEMPAHTTALLAAYPQFSCTGGPFTVPPGGVWPITDIFCAGNDSTFLFLQDILTEVMELFPGTFIHIGGDEANKAEWKRCSKCQARIRAEGLQGEDELQSYFIKRIERFINARGRRLIGWDEILEGGLAPNATVMSWRGVRGGIEAARSGHDVVMSPTSHCYFDYYQGDPQYEPLAIGGHIPLEKVYAFEPTPDTLTLAQAAHVLGAQANLWGEYVPGPDHAEYMMFPRLTALSEVVWTAKDRKDWNDFSNRLWVFLKRLDRMGVNYARSALRPETDVKADITNRRISIVLSSALPDMKIRYTLDGSEPRPGSPLYENPVELENSAVLKAAGFREGTRISGVISESLKLHKAAGKKVSLKNPPSSRYTGGGGRGLVNILRGTVNHRDGHWLGFEGDDLDALIDLGEVTTVRRIAAGFLHSMGSWIFLPVSVEYEVSLDGENFRTVAVLEPDLDPKHSESVVQEIPAGLEEPVEVRYIRVRARNRKTCPDWHRGAGGNAWLFADEIVVE